jgi:hypothetical protein
MVAKGAGVSASSNGGVESQPLASVVVRDRARLVIQAGGSELRCDGNEGDEKVGEEKVGDSLPAPKVGWLCV